MNNFKKKTLTILALLLVVACGGGAKSGNPTSNTTPVASKTEDAKDPDEDLKGGISWNEPGFKYSSKNPHNKTSAVTQTGSGVTIGILDTGFKTTDSDLQGIMASEFGTRLSYTTAYGVETNDRNHGINVSQVAGGATLGTAKGVKIIGMDIVKESTNSNGEKKFHPNSSLEAYKFLFDRGIRIFNQSFGIDDEVTTFNQNQAKYQINNSNTENILGFYKDAINNGALFVWAAGNDKTQKNPSLEGGLPYVFNELEKGWINVVGLTNSNDKTGSTKWNELERLNGAGVAKNWTVTAVSEITIQTKFKDKKGIYNINGSSFAAPIVTGTAALIKEKYPFMTGDLLRQTILSTATDIGTPGVDEDYGWGLLNIEKALKGPALFDKRLALGDKVYINLDGGTYAFDNDISGDAGLALSGIGTLTLNGNATYTGETTVGSNVRLKTKNLVSPRTLSISKNAVVEVSDSNINNIQNEGTFINNGNSVANTVAMSADSQMYSDINANLKVKNAEINGTVTITNNNGEYLTKNGKNIDIITGNVTGNADIKTSSELLDAKSEVSSVGVQATVSRKDVMEYAISKNSTEQQVNTAEQIETTLTHLDSLAENGTASKETLSNGAQLQLLTSATLDTMSGQIYASAQALTFEQSEVVNKDLSNRMSDLARSLENDKKFGFWTSGIFSKGKIEKDGFAKGKTNVKGGQVGFDMKLNENGIVGISADYSKGKVKFDRYNGKSKADSTGISVYGRQNLGNSYIAGRLGFGYADTDVERDIIANSNIFEHSKVNHKDKSISGYFEGGYDIKNKNSDFVFTPYAALGADNVTRGKFSEENTKFGMKADKKSYNLPYATVGGRIAKTFGKIDVTGYAGYTHGLNKKDLEFAASYNFSPEAKFTVKGINYSRNKINAGIGVNAKVKEGINWYSNYDFKHSADKSKANNHMVTTGVRFEF
ncbi:autotransporter domain-containing protein [Leptotrichia sp. HSP-536]|uniref:Autotransporter domain-containing protein n=1 Tax=Leptotrichia alba TaxID=3239304 RepID=A0AB39V5P8_9FUSO